MNEANFNPEARPEPISPPPPEKQTEILEKITPERVLDTWHALALVERKFVVTTDEQFDQLIDLIQPEKAKLFKALRELINSQNELASGIMKELESDISSSAYEDPEGLTKIFLEEFGEK